MPTNLVSRCLTLTGLLTGLLTADALGDEPTSNRLDFFETHVRPVLAKRCYGCHSGNVAEPKGGLRLDRRESLVAGGDSGPVLDANQPDQSPLLLAVRRTGDVSAMPPDSPLPAEELAAIERWVRDGAAMPAEVKSAGDAELHWAFQPVRRPMVKRVSAEAAHAIDALCDQRRESAGLKGASPAARRVLARRLYFDLQGLPPTYEQVQEFVHDDHPAAYERLVDRLLASSGFGEHWARAWMDVSRYADTKGYVFQEDRAYPDAHRYRSWVIGAFNRDMPYDEFLQTQLAADRLDDANGDDRWAMGYLTLGRLFLRNRHDIIDDRIDVVTRGMLGLTVTCARCHDHKYDPIPARDYYALYGVFASTKESPENALWLTDVKKPHDSPILLRGRPGNRGPIAPRRFLSALAGEDAPRFTDGSGRLELAQAIADPENPLTARVWVNRVWGRLLGRHLVTTPSDFGLRSDPPALPETLDYLAAGLTDHQWSHKWLVRTIVMSQTYRARSNSDEDSESKDPENQFAWRQSRRRLQFEQLRDALLYVSGRLDGGRVGGVSTHLDNPKLPPRRTLYAHIDRQNLPQLFRTFDFASPDTHAPRRYETTVPQQALFLMNSAFALDCAASLSQRAATGDRRDDRAFIDRVYCLALARQPTDQEQALARGFLAQVAGQRGRELLALALLQSNEFLFLD